MCTVALNLLKTVAETFYKEIILPLVKTLYKVVKSARHLR